MKNLLLKELYVFQSVTPHLSFGGEVFWAGQHRKSGIGYAARYNTEKMVMLASVCPYHIIIKEKWILGAYIAI